MKLNIVTLKQNSLIASFILLELAHLGYEKNWLSIVLIGLTIYIWILRRRICNINQHLSITSYSNNITYSKDPIEAIIKIGKEIQLREKQQSLFFLEALHEIGSSLTVFHGALSYLKVQDSSIEYKKIMHQRCIYMKALFGDLRTYLLCGTGEVRLQIVLLSDFFYDFQENVDSRQFENGNQISCHFNQLEEYARLDPLRLQQVLTNLLDNALHYSKDGAINISASINQSYLNITVSDTGIGIEAEDLKFIFHQFWRAKNAKSFHEGSGLGLAIVEKIVKLHNGSISCNSDIGNGTCFDIVLPVVVED